MDRCWYQCTDDLRYLCDPAGNRADAGPRFDAAPEVATSLDAEDTLDATGDTERLETADLAAPRPVAPLSTTFVTSQQPTLQWALPAGVTGATVELCRDRGFRLDCRQFVAMGSGGRPPSSLDAGVWFWRLRARNIGAVGATPSAAWYFVVRARSATVDTSFGSQPDFNGDGVADLGVQTTGAFGNRVHIYSGAMGGPPASPSASAVDASASGSGRRLANVGDVNGDGFGDLALGVPTGSSTSHVRVYLGSATGLALASPIMLSAPDETGAPGFGSVVSGAGDVDGDGYADLLVGTTGGIGSGHVYVYAGRPDGVGTTPAVVLSASMPDETEFGSNLVAAGDLNGDRYADVAVLVPGAVRDTGAVEVFLGSAGGLHAASDARLDGPDGEGGLFASSVAGASDVNGDGYADLIVAAPRAQMGTGRLHVYPGFAGGVRATPAISIDTGGLEPDYGLVNVAAAGDSNADGFDDVVVGTPHEASVERHAHPFLGATSGLPSFPVGSLQGAYMSNVLLAEPVAGVGDINADGLADIALGLPGVMDRTGLVYVYFGTTAGVSSMPSAMIAGPDGTATQFGAALTTR